MEPEEILYSEVPGGWPMPEGMFEAVNKALGDAKHAPNLEMEPERLLCSNREIALATMNSYVGSATELEYKRKNKLTALESHYQGKYAEGVNYTGPDNVRRNFQIDHQSQTRIWQIGGKRQWDSNSYWIAADNTHMLLPRSGDGDNFRDWVETYVQQLILTNRTKKDELIVLRTAAAVDAYDITTGWPAN